MVIKNPLLDPIKRLNKQVKRSADVVGIFHLPQGRGGGLCLQLLPSVYKTRCELWRKLGNDNIAIAFDDEVF